MLSLGLKLETSTVPEVSCIFIGRKLDLLKKQLKRNFPKCICRSIGGYELPGGCVFVELEGVLL
jgi:hypothetical protein